MASLALASCSNNDDETNFNPQEEGDADATLVINIDASKQGGGTRAEALPTGNDATNIERLTVITVPTGSSPVEYMQTFEKAEIVNNTVTMKVKSGRPNVYAYINMTDAELNILKGLADISQSRHATYMPLTNTLRQSTLPWPIEQARIGEYAQSPEWVPMSGYVNTVNIARGSTTPVTISVGRFVSLVSLEKVSVKLKDYKGDPAGKDPQGPLVQPERVYMKNVMSMSNLDMVPNYNSNDAKPDTPITAVDKTTGTVNYPWLLNDFKNPEPVGIMEPIVQPTYGFYVFPNYTNNSAEKYTSMVIQARYYAYDANRTVIDATTPYETVYYPIAVNLKGNGITVDKGAGDGVITRNQLYKINLSITGKGSDDPDKPIPPTEGSMEVNISVADWFNIYTQEPVFD
jgi:hypothetical protein